jgi:GxxExxY protein
MVAMQTRRLGEARSPRFRGFAGQNDDLKRLGAEMFPRWRRGENVGFQALATLRAEIFASLKQRRETIGMHENEIGTQILAAAIEVHRELGPGLLEAVYEIVLARELADRGLAVARQVPVAIAYKGLRFDEGFRTDIVVEGKVLLELKSVEQVLPVHKKQVQTYLRLTGIRLGYLLNFGSAVLKEGITRCVNRLEEEFPGAQCDERTR